MRRRIAKATLPEPAGYGPAGPDSARVTCEDFTAAASASAIFRGFASHAEPPQTAKAARLRLSPESARLIMMGGVATAAIAAIGISWLATQPPPPPTPAPTPRPVVAPPPPLPMATLATAPATEPIAKRPQRAVRRQAATPPPDAPLKLAQPAGAPPIPAIAGSTALVVISPPPALPVSVGAPSADPEPAPAEPASPN